MKIILLSIMVFLYGNLLFAHGGWIGNQHEVKEENFWLVKDWGGSKGTRLEITYFGKLNTCSSENDKLNLRLYLRLNGRDGLFNLSYCTRYSGIQGAAHRPAVTLVLSSLETDIFFYALDQFGKANIWDLEMAVVNSDGTWDSLDGKNYKYSID